MSDVEFNTIISINEKCVKRNKEKFASIKLNLIINAKFSKSVKNLLNTLKKDSDNDNEFILEKLKKDSDDDNDKICQIKNEWNKIFDMIMRQFEIDTTIYIPTSISNFIIKTYIDINAADFYYDITDHNMFSSAIDFDNPDSANDFDNPYSVWKRECDVDEFTDPEYEYLFEFKDNNKEIIIKMLN